VAPIRKSSSEEELDFFDEIALLTADPDANLDVMRRRFAEDARVPLSETVFNALLQREEKVLEG
jgi:hypothetical protein